MDEKEEVINDIYKTYAKCIGQDYRPKKYTTILE